MHIPEGFDENNNVCLLKKSLYGLKQAPLKWNRKFTGFLKERGLISLKADHCIFKNKNGTLFLAIYVDDGLLLAENQEELDSLLEDLGREFEIVKNEDPSTFLGIEIIKTENYIGLRQKDYVKSILRKFNMEEAKTASTPMITKDKNEKNQNIEKDFPFREAVGSLLYLMNKTRPDIAFSVSFCSRKMENPAIQDILNVKKVMRYLKGTYDEGISYTRNSNQSELIGYSDSDFAGDIEERKSTTGFVIFFCGGPVAWCSRKQPIVALSTTEAEYIAAADCTKELVYLKSLIEDLTNQNVKVKLKVDNQSSIKLVKNGQFNRRSKHIDVRYHFINEKVSEGDIDIEYCCSENQIGDIFTKPLGNLKYFKHKESLIEKF